VVTNGMNQVVGSYGSYADARRRWDLLAGRRFPMDRVRIVAHGSVGGPGRSGWARFGGAVVRGWLLGVVTGFAAGLLAGLLVLTEPLGAALTVAAAGAIVGAVAGVVLGLGLELAAAGRVAERYDLVADEPVADWARSLLADEGGEGHPDPA
jgi:hypothetical protein